MNLATLAPRQVSLTLLLWAFALLLPAPPAAGFESCGATFKEVATTGFYGTGGLYADGHLVLWGYSSSLPDGIYTTVAAGGMHVCAIAAGSGTVTCWGSNASPSNGTTYVGQAMPPTGSFTHLAAGWAHTCGIRADDSAECWGLNSSGQATPPTQAFGLLAAGQGHTCGIDKTDGSVACWGSNSEGQAAPPTGVYTQLAAGSAHTCGIRADGSIECWGSNSQGQSTPPAGVFTRIGAGSEHNCAISEDGSVVCWGRNNSGQATPPAGTFTQISGGFFDTTCGLKTDGTISCWGSNMFGATRPPCCGNGVLSIDEQCEDGNAVETDACLSTCRFNACGDGIIREGVEACDDGNAVNGDGCDVNCTASGCGNGAVSPGEECDDGNLIETDACRSNCVASTCGDGIIRTGVENCEDGNLLDGDGCDSNCRVTACGNGVQTGTESCDDGNLSDGDGCDGNCSPTGCGNGILTSGEICDDGNDLDGDGCDHTCVETGCPNGIVSSGEVCDDGNYQDGDGCDRNCTLTGCGNGIHSPGEDCDQGDLEGGAIVGSYRGIIDTGFDPVYPHQFNTTCIFGAPVPGSEPWDVFGTPVATGPILCVRETVNGVSGPNVCKSVDPDTLVENGLFDTTLSGGDDGDTQDTCANPPTCTKWSLIGRAEATGLLQDQVMTNLPPESTVVYTLDGMESGRSFCVNGCPKRIPGCPWNGGVWQHSNYRLAVNAFVDQYTDAGSNVTVSSRTGFLNPITTVQVPITVDVTFSQVTQAGRTMVVVQSNHSNSLGGFSLGQSGFQPSFLDITTTAQFTGPVTVCTRYPDTDNDGIVDGSQISEADLKFLHGGDGAFVDVTTSQDLDDNVVCGQVEHLSPFVATLPRSLCSDTARQDCVATKGSLSIARDPTDSTRNSMKFKLAGPAANLGNPLTHTSYALCVYDDQGLALDFPIPPALTEGPLSAAWTSSGAGKFKFKDKVGSSGGITAVSLKSATKTLVSAKAKGSNVAAPARMPLGQGVTMQFVSDADLCFTHAFDPGLVSKNSDTKFSAR